MMANRLSPRAFSQPLFSRIGGSTLTNRVTTSGSRGRRRRSIGGFRPDLSFFGGLL
jgi:hypothetical protein